MKLLAVSIFLHAALSEAFLSRASPCCFHLNTTMGPVGQLSDGQNRINQPGLATGQYCIDGDGGLTDQNGRGCILTPPTTQFQCDTGAAPTPNFSVGCNGTFAYNENPAFVACPTGDNGGYNLYTTAPAGQQGCITVPLIADGCKSGCPAAPAASSSPKVCPLDLSGAYEYPHLIVPIDSSKPTTALGTSYNGTVSSTISSIFNFDIPAADTGKTCSLVFLFPEQSKLETSAFSISGNGDIDFYLLNGTATLSTTYANAPGIKQEYGMANFWPGHTYSVATFPCPAGTAISVEAKACGDTMFNYFQDYNPQPIGLYISKC